MENVVKIAAAKEEFAARIGQVSTEMQSALKNKVVQLVDYSMYAARYIGTNTTIELMQSADKKKVGVTNVNSRKLEANEYALFTGMQLLQSSAAKTRGTTDEAVAAADYGKIDQTIANGEIELKQGDRILMPRSSCEAFRTSQYTDKLVGYVAFDSPKMVTPLSDIIPTLYLAAPCDETTNNTFIKCVFYGVKTNKA